MPNTNDVRSFCRICLPPGADRLAEGAAQEILTGIGLDRHKIAATALFQRILEPHLVKVFRIRMRSSDSGEIMCYFLGTES